jgi:hypothetical protein
MSRLTMTVFLTLAPSSVGRSVLDATRRRGVSTWRTLLKPRSMLPRTLRAESGVSFGVVTPVLKQCQRSIKLKTNTNSDHVSCFLHDLLIGTEKSVLDFS